MKITEASRRVATGRSMAHLKGYTRGPFEVETKQGAKGRQIRGWEQAFVTSRTQMATGAAKTAHGGLEYNIAGRTKRDNLVLVLNRPIIR